jgi:hypothetical protein
MIRDSDRQHGWQLGTAARSSPDHEPRSTPWTVRRRSVRTATRQMSSQMLVHLFRTVAAANDGGRGAVSILDRGRWQLRMGGLTGGRTLGPGMAKSTPWTVRRRSVRTATRQMSSLKLMQLFRTVAAAIDGGRGACRSSTGEGGSFDGRIDQRPRPRAGHGEINSTDREAALGLYLRPTRGAAEPHTPVTDRRSDNQPWARRCVDPRCGKPAPADRGIDLQPQRRSRAWRYRAHGP